MSVDPADRRTHPAVQAAGDLLRARLEWEAANPRPKSIVRAERAIVRALKADGFGTQHQVTRHDRFDIAVDDLLIRVEWHRPCPDCKGVGKTRCACWPGCPSERQCPTCHGLGKLAPE